MVNLKQKKKHDMIRKKLTNINKKKSKNTNQDYKSLEVRVIIQEKIEHSLIKYQKHLKPIFPELYEGYPILLEDKLKGIKHYLSQEGLEKEAYLALIAFLRQTICDGNQKIAERVFELDLFEIVMKFSRSLEYPEMIHEVTWILTNLTSIEKTEFIDYLLQEEFQVIPFLGKMINSEIPKIKENSLWCFSNLLAEEEKVFDDVLNTDLVHVWEKELEKKTISPTNLRWITWGMSNLWRVKHKDIGLIAFIINSISQLIYVDDEAISDVVSCLKYLTKIEEESHILIEKLNLIAEAEIIGKIVDLIFTKEKFCHQLLWVLSNLLSFSHGIIEEQIYNSGFFSRMWEYMNNSPEEETVIKGMFFALSNFIAEDAKNILLLKETGIFDKTLAFIKENPMNDAWKEAYWVIWNMIEACGMELRIELTKQYDLGEKLGYMLKRVNNIPNLWTLVLFSLVKLFQTELYFEESWNERPIYSFMIAGGINCLNDLMSRSSTVIFLTSRKILQLIWKRFKEEIINIKHEKVDNIHL
jgi:hypothetical protein